MDACPSRGHGWPPVVSPDELLLALEALLQGERRAVILSGPSGAGKTELARELAGRLRRRGVVVGGVVSPRELEAGRTVGYRVQDLLTGEEVRLCSLRPPGIRFRRYFFSPQGVEFGNRALERAAVRARLAVVDELGPWELAGEGFAPGLRRLRAADIPLLLTVRPWLVEEALGWLGLAQDTPVIRLA